MIINANEKIKECDIAAIPMCDAKYYEAIRGGYARELDYLHDINLSLQENENKPQALDSASLDAKYAMQALFTAAKGGPS